MYNPEKAFHLDSNEKAHTPVGSWRIHWSSELSDAMYALAVDGIVELWWLSTWQPYCSQILDPMLGWIPCWSMSSPGMILSPNGDVRRANGRPSNDAYASNAKRINPRRSYGSTMMNASNSARSSWRKLQPKAPVLMVRPDYRIGISRRQWKLIDTFVHHPEQFDTVTFDMEPTCRIYDIHHGF